MNTVVTLSIIIPVYNEAPTIQQLLDKIAVVNLIENVKKEIILVNDSSTDETEKIVSAYINSNPNLMIRQFRHEKNLGKGASVQTGVSRASGNYLVIQDADLEYDPEEYNLLLRPVLKGEADVVYGSRFSGGNAHRVLFFWHSIGNKFLTFLSNAFTNLNLTDMESGFKLFPTAILQKIPLKEKRFGFEPEITAKISRVPDIRIYEVGISYHGRTYKEGKKINWKDGIRAIYCIIKYNLFL